MACTITRASRFCSGLRLAYRHLPRCQPYPRFSLHRQIRLILSCPKVGLRGMCVGLDNECLW